MLAITGQHSPNDLEGDPFTLPTWQGRLGIRIPSKIADRELQLSLEGHFIPEGSYFNEGREYNYDIINNQLQNKVKICKDNKVRNQEEAKKYLFTTA